MDMWDKSKGFLKCFVWCAKLMYIWLSLPFYCVCLHFKCHMYSCSTFHFCDLFHYLLLHCKWDFPQFSPWKNHFVVKEVGLFEQIPASSFPPPKQMLACLHYKFEKVKWLNWLIYHAHQNKPACSVTTRVHQTTPDFTNLLPEIWGGTSVLTLGWPAAIVSTILSRYHICLRDATN